MLSKSNYRIGDCAVPEVGLTRTAAAGRRWEVVGILPNDHAHVQYRVLFEAENFERRISALDIDTPPDLPADYRRSDTSNIESGALAEGSQRQGPKNNVFTPRHVMAGERTRLCRYSSGDSNVDQALRVLKKKVQREGLFREMKARSAYEKRSEKRTREKSEAIRRQRKFARKRISVGACSRW